MDDEGQGVHLVTGKQDIEFHQIARAIVGELVIKGRIALCTALELVEEIEDELSQGHVEPHLNGFLREMDHVGGDTAMLDGELHDRAGVLGRRDDLGFEVGLLDAVDARCVGKVLRAADLDHGAIGLIHVVVHRRAGGDQGKTELALEALLDNLHMEQSQKPTRKPKPTRRTSQGST